MKEAARSFAAVDCNVHTSSLNLWLTQNCVNYLKMVHAPTQIVACGRTEPVRTRPNTRMTLQNCPHGLHSEKIAIVQYAAET